MADPAVLFDTALRITHPSRGKGGSLKDKVSSAVCLLFGRHAPLSHGKISDALLTRMTSFSFSKRRKSACQSL